LKGLHSCAPIQGNHATYRGNEETEGKSIMQPSSLKTLAAAVLKRNQQCNQGATNTEKPCNFLLQNAPPKLHAGNPRCTLEEGEYGPGGESVENVEAIENKKVLHVDTQEQIEEEELHNTPYTPESCINSAHRQRNHATLSLLPVAEGATDATGNCEFCPAAGYWDNSQYAGQGPLCFHYAYYLGRSGKPKPCAEMRTMCPRKATR